MPVRITTWNVNGIRNPFKYQPWRDRATFQSMFDGLEADIVVFQELKIQRKDLNDEMVLVPGWDCFFSLPKHKNGYSGVGIYTRHSKCVPIRAEEGLLGLMTPPKGSQQYRDMPEADTIGGYPTDEQLDSLSVKAMTLEEEGRCVVVEFDAFVLIGLYCPANSNGLRDDFRHDFFRCIDWRVRALGRAGKRVIVLGDLNVTSELGDSACALQESMQGKLDVEDYLESPCRTIFNALHGKVSRDQDGDNSDALLVDIPRKFHPDRQKMYTHWDQRMNARPANFGSRIDHILCSRSMQDWFIESDIQEGLMGSDHCPVYAVIQDLVPVQQDGRTAQVHIADLLHPAGTVVGGVTRGEKPEVGKLAFSGRRLPNFANRQSITSMFARISKPRPEKGPAETQTGSRSASDRVPAPSAVVSAPNANAAAPVSARDAPPPPPPPPPQPPRPRGDGNPDRARPTTPPAGPTSKRSKTSARAPPPPPASSASSAGSAAPPNPGAQPSVASFFGRRPPPPPALSRQATPANAQAGPANGDGRLQSVRSQPATGPRDRPDQVPDQVPEQATNRDSVAAAWSALFKKPDPPRCKGHNEPCVKFTCSKKGPNQGRLFWVCSRPPNPTTELVKRNSSASTSTTDWKCNTFLWN